MNHREPVFTGGREMRGREPERTQAILLPDTTAEGLCTNNASATFGPASNDTAFRASDKTGGLSLKSCASVATMCTIFFSTNFSAASFDCGPQNPVKAFAVTCTRQPSWTNRSTVSRFFIRNAFRSG